MAGMDVEAAVSGAGAPDELGAPVALQAARITHAITTSHACLAYIPRLLRTRTHAKDAR